MFGGGYVFKHSGDFWSDHAYGTAVDATDEAKGRDNEKHFRWYVRMAQAGLISYDYIIGSIDGRVHSAQAPDFEIEPGGGDSSHEWHCHISHIDHDGRRPSRPGGWT